MLYLPKCKVDHVTSLLKDVHWFPSPTGYCLRSLVWLTNLTILTIWLFSTHQPSNPCPQRAHRCHMLTYPTEPLPKTSHHALKISRFLMPLQLWTCFSSVFIPVPSPTFLLFVCLSLCRSISHITICVMPALATTRRAGHHSPPGIIIYSSFFSYFSFCNSD